jgi:DNA-binding beta-propeller fold protein YncE
VPGLRDAGSVAVSADRSDVYVGARGLVHLRRDRGTGALTPAGCQDIQGPCEVPGFLPGGSAVAVTPDGRQVYAVADRVVHAFARDPEDGSLQPLGCPFGDTVPDCRPEVYAGELLVAPDGRTVHLGLRTYAREPVSGALREVGCAATPCEGLPTGIRSLALSPDGRSAYGPSWGTYEAFATGGGNLLAYAGDPRTGLLTPTECFGTERPGRTCVPTPHLNSPERAIVSGDGRAVYVLRSTARRNDGLVVVFARDPVTGALAETGCFSQGAGGTGCTQARVIGASRAMAISPDGRNLYVAGDSRIATFGPAVGLADPVLTGVADGTTAAQLSCPFAAGRCSGSLALRSIGGTRTVLATRSFSIPRARSGRVALRLTKRGRRLLGTRRSMRAVATVGATGAVAVPTVREVTLRR